MSDVRKTLKDLADQNGGVITPDLVIKVARDPSNPLHYHFTWDNTEAAHKQRLYEARALIRSVKVVVTTTQLSVAAPVWVRDPSAPTAAQGYVSLRGLRSDADLAREVMVSEFSRASQALSRAKAVAAVLNMSDSVGDVMDSIRVLSAQLDNGAGMAGSA